MCRFLFKFFVFAGFSVCSNGMKGEIDISVAQAIRKLDMDIHASTYLGEPAEVDHGDECVVEAEIVIPEEALVQSPNRSASNFNNRSNSTTSICFLGLKFNFLFVCFKVFPGFLRFQVQTCSHFLAKTKVD